MKIKILLAAMLIAGGISGCGQSETSTAATAEKSAQQNPVFEPIVDDPALPRVLLIGDSISVGYTLPVRELLKGKFNVHRVGENGGPTTNGLAKLDHWLGEKKWDVIHFNWGLHDLKFMPDGQRQVPPEAYEKNLRDLVKRLKATGAKLIWASTTPVPEGKLNPQRNESDVIAYNEIARRIMEENGVTVNDLHAFALPQLDKIQRRQNVHFTEEGSATLAKPVAENIEAALKSAR